MRSPRSIGRHPYAVVVRYMPMDGPRDDHVQGYRRSLSAAVEECRAAAFNWARLIGGAYPALGWFVIDCRDGTEHHPTHITRGRKHHGEEQQSAGGLW